MSLTRQQMVEVLRGGGVILHEGRMIRQEKNLPTAAALSKTPEQRAAALGDLETQIAALQTQKDSLAADKGNNQGGSGDLSGSKNDPPEVPDYKKMKKPELMAEAEKRGLPATEETTIAQLIELLIAK